LSLRWMPDTPLDMLPGARGEGGATPPRNAPTGQRELIQEVSTSVKPSALLVESPRVVTKRSDASPSLPPKEAIGHKRANMPFGSAKGSFWVRT
jgi:hypothetical protein